MTCLMYVKGNFIVGNYILHLLISAISKDTLLIQIHM